jgi:hypothetical protein
LELKGVFGMAPEPNSSVELGGASQTPQLQKELELPNSRALVHFFLEFLEHLFLSFGIL